MNCKYCQQETKQISKTNGATVSLTHFMCEICHVDYEYVAYPMEEGVLINETLFAIKIKEKDFEVRFHYGSKQTGIYYLEWISFPNKHGGTSPTKIRHTFHIFPHLLDWTPFNAKDKLELLLPFF